MDHSLPKCEDRKDATDILQDIIRDAPERIADLIEKLSPLCEGEENVFGRVSLEDYEYVAINYDDYGDGPAMRFNFFRNKDFEQIEIFICDNEILVSGRNPMDRSTACAMLGTVSKTFKRDDEAEKRCQVVWEETDEVGDINDFVDFAIRAAIIRGEKV